MNDTFKLGRSIAQIVPFYRCIKEKEIFTKKILIIMAIVAVAKITVFILCRFNTIKEVFCFVTTNLIKYPIQYS